MLNELNVIGNVGMINPVKEFEGGNKVVNFTVASNKVWKDKDGKKQEKTTWFNIDAWGSLAETIEKYVKQGDLVYIKGAMDFTKTEDKVYHSVNLEQIKFLSPKNKS